MSELVPSQNEEALSRCKALYLGTSIFNSDPKKFNEARLTLSQLQESISQRYPIDGSNYVRGVQTCLSIYPSGIQMEHSSLRGPTAISALFFYPIKSLVYCGALRFVKQPTQQNNNDAAPKPTKSWKFVPLDSETAQMDKNLRNPPLFVAFVRGFEPSTKRQIIECHVFVVGMVKTAMNLVESCQKAFYESKVAVGDFYKKYGNVPVVFCMKDDLSSRNGTSNDSRMVVKNFDLNGYHYATDQTPIDVWQLFEEGDMPLEAAANDGKSTAALNRGPPTKRLPPTQLSQKQAPQQPSKISDSRSDLISSSREGILKQTSLTTPNNSQPLGMPMPQLQTSTANTVPMSSLPPSVMSSAKSSQIVDPYEPTANLVQVEKRVDPNTGQNIYVRYLNPDKSSRTSSNNGISQIIYKDGNGGSNIHDLIYSNQYDLDEECSEAFKKREYPPIIIRQEKTPSPIIVEKYVKKKAPQVIIKEIHVQEPAPPPIKVVEKMDGSQAQSIFANENKKFTPIYESSDCADQLSGSINTVLTRPSIQSAPVASQPLSRFRNMICHTTYETLRGEPVFPQPNNQFYLPQNNVATGGGGAPDVFNKCAPSNFNSIPIRRPLMKDINFYLNKAENQMMRHQQQQQQQIAQVSHHHHHHHHKPSSHHSHRVPPPNEPSGHVARRPAKQQHLDVDKRKSYMDSTIRDLDHCRQYGDDKYSDDERSYPSRYDHQQSAAPVRPKPMRPSANDQPLSPTSLPPQQRQPKSILTKRPPVTATLKGEMLNRYFRGFIAEEYGYY